MSSFYKDSDHQATEEESIRVIHQAIQSGVTLLDTSDVYGPFTNEELLGTPFVAFSQHDRVICAAHCTCSCCSTPTSSLRAMSKLRSLIILLGGC